MISVKKIGLCIILLTAPHYATHTYQIAQDLPLFLPPSSLDIIQKESTPITRTHKQEKKDWTFIVYIAGDNDLRGFAARNIKQMASIGSNAHINIVVHLDIRIAGNQKITRRYYIEKNRILHVNPDDKLTERMDSGCPKTLESCCKWAIEHYPAKNFALVLWNHGTGILDPARGRIINPVQLFAFNQKTHLFDVDRSIEFFDWVDNNMRGICWDDTTGNYLTNQKLDKALGEICLKHLNGQKFAIIAFDACLMSMLGIANIIKKHAHIMVGSQEVELGTGYNYALALDPFARHSLTKEEFAHQIVRAYEQAYSNITSDYTQSAITLKNIDALENNVSKVASLLIECLNKQKNGSVRNALRHSRSKHHCTHFDEPRYIDLCHLYKNIRANLESFKFQDAAYGKSLTLGLKAQLDRGIQLIKESVLCNTTGKNLRKAHGISIYFPEDTIHPSFPQTSFATQSQWLLFIRRYLKGP